jgi:multicomponent Na+:H+ antiporter subunit E
MRRFAWYLLVPLAWCALRGHISPLELVLGLFVAWAVQRPARGEPDVAHPAGPVRRRGVRRLWTAVTFTLFFLKEVASSTWQVAKTVVTMRPRPRPAVLGLPLDAESDAEITLLANLITLTPGTLALDVSMDRQTLYVHAMFAEDPDEVLAHLKHGFERRVLELLR